MKNHGTGIVITIINHREIDVAEPSGTFLYASADGRKGTRSRGREDHRSDRLRSNRVPADGFFIQRGDTKERLWSYESVEKNGQIFDAQKY